METCFRCDRSDEEVRLIDAVYNDEIVKVCEECALVENIPVIRKPSLSQLAESEKPYTVRERLRRMAGLPEKKDEVSKMTRKIMENVTLDNLRKRDYKSELDKKFELARKRNVPLNLIDNFNWMIMMARKKRKMYRKQLAEAIGESEAAIKMIENKELPDDDSRIINKIEQYFNIGLRKDDGKLLWHRLISAEKIEKIESKEKPEKEKIEEKKEIEKPAVVLKFDKETTKNITIADLQKMKKERERREAIEKAGIAASLKKEINVAELVWRSKQEGKPEVKEKKEIGEENLVGSDIEIEGQNS